MMKNHPREKIDQSNSAGKESHDDSDIESLDGEDDKVVGYDPHDTEKGTSTQKLQRSHSLSHQVIQAFTDSSNIRTE